MPSLQEFDTLGLDNLGGGGGPSEFQLFGAHDDEGFVFSRMGNRTALSVWKCAKSAEGYNTTGHRLHFFKTGRLYLLAHGDEATVAPQELQAAYIEGHMFVFSGSLETDDGEGATEHAYHVWDFFSNGHWEGRRFQCAGSWPLPATC